MKPKLEPIKLEGPPKERGKIHGDCQKEKIWEITEQERYSLFELGIKPDDFVDEFFQETRYYEIAKKIAPDLMEEIIGIAEATGIDHKVIFIHNCGDEVWRYLQSKNIFPPPPHMCTSIGAIRNRNYPTMQGQNLDTSTDSRNFEVILHIKEPSSSLETLVVGRSGQLGYFGLNNSPLALNLNTINCNSSTEGLPLAFMCRLILQKKHIDEAKSLLFSTQLGATQNFVIGDLNNIIDLEVSANECVEFIPYENYQYVYHSNHAIINKDLIAKENPSDNSLNRFKFLEQRLRYSTTPVSLENMKLILSSHFGPICYHAPLYQASVSRTWISMISVLAKSPELHLAVGNPCENPFHVYRFGD